MIEQLMEAPPTPRGILNYSYTIQHGSHVDSLPTQAPLAPNTSPLVTYDEDYVHGLNVAARARRGLVNV